MGKSLDLSGIPTTSAPSQPRAAPDLDTLEAVERRVLWLATAIVHHANRVRENRSGVKVGGHQASSASMVSLMTALWFSELRAEDHVVLVAGTADGVEAAIRLLQLARRHVELARGELVLEQLDRLSGGQPAPFMQGRLGWQLRG